MFVHAFATARTNLQHAAQCGHCPEPHEDCVASPYTLLQRCETNDMEIVCTLALRYGTITTNVHANFRTCTSFFQRAGRLYETKDLEVRITSGFCLPFLWKRNAAKQDANRSTFVRFVCNIAWSKNMAYLACLCDFSNDHNQFLTCLRASDCK